MVMSCFDSFEILNVFFCNPVHHLCQWRRTVQHNCVHYLNNMENRSKWYRCAIKLIGSLKIQANLWSKPNLLKFHFMSPISEFLSLYRIFGQFHTIYRVLPVVLCRACRSSLFSHPLPKRNMLLLNLESNSGPQIWQAHLLISHWPIPTVSTRQSFVLKEEAKWCSASRMNTDNTDIHTEWKSTLAVEFKGRQLVRLWWITRRPGLECPAGAYVALVTALTDFFQRFLNNGQVRGKIMGATCWLYALLWYISPVGGLVHPGFARNTAEKKIGPSTSSSNDTFT
jgi:hypothetical protein